jgi:hypothetical protein
MKKLIIHIGFHKTGTSFLNQKFFPVHSEIHHLGKPYDHDSPIREFVERIVGPKEYDPEKCKVLYDEYIRPFREDKIVSISDGRIATRIIDNNLKEIPKRLLNVTSDVAVIITIRRQYDYLKSLYVQKVGSDNEKKSFNQWFDDNWEGGTKIKDQLEYLDKIQAYLDVLGKEKVKVCIYENFRENISEFLQDLCSFIDLDCVTFEKEFNNEEKINQRMTILHRFIATHSALRYIAMLIKKIVPKKIQNSMRHLIFNNFKHYDPELSVDRIRLVKEHTRIVNNKIISELDIDLSKYYYDT